jgi:hypothetical protein|tara:strand:- start:1106 stop:1387 length:282 start_codon:yes stop_codon:yes gene_type:complete
MEKKMTKNDVLTMLRVGNVPIEFVKVDGTMRTMTATLNENQIVYTPSDSANANRKPNDGNCSVWDVQDNAWKSFRWANLRFVDGTNLPDGVSN